MYNMKQKGFSLIELTISLTIFLTIMGIAVSLLLSTLQQQKRILAEQELLNQSVYGVEYMSTALKMAVKDPDGSCLGSPGGMYLLTHCSSGQACQGVKFINGLDNNACQEFFLDTANPAAPLLKQAKSGFATQNILSDKFKIKYARFILNGDKTKLLSGSSDTVQPRITMLLDVQVQASGDTQEKVIQTTVSPRNLIK